jgi:hypothetical protein
MPPVGAQAGAAVGLRNTLASLLSAGGKIGSHEVAVGQTVRFFPDRWRLALSRGWSEDTRLLPGTPAVQDRPTSHREGYERVAGEDRLREGD